MKKHRPGSEEYKLFDEENSFLVKWRLTGAMQKLHNLMGWIRRGVQRREQFIQLTRGELTEEELLEFGQVLWNVDDLGGLMVKQENDTRWNSYLESAKRALQLKDPLEIFQRRMVHEKDPKKRLPLEYCLGDDDWSFLGITIQILEPFLRLTKRFESREPRISEVAASLHFLIDHLRRQEQIYNDDLINPSMTGPDFAGSSIFAGHTLPRTPVAPPTTQSAVFSDRPRRQRRLPLRYRDNIDEVDHSDDEETPHFFDRDNLRALRASLAIAIHKIEKYVAVLEHSPAYWAAMILHPGLKKRWIERNLSQRKTTEILQTFGEFFDAQYDQRDTSLPAGQQTFRLGAHHLTDEDFYDKPEDLALKDEVTEYLRMPLLPVDDPLDWWRRHQTSLPKLARMAFDIISIPATSCEVERVFSQSKLIISTQRHRLMDETLEMLVCLKYWLPKRAS